MILYTLESLNVMHKEYPVVVATSDESSDKATVSFCRENNVNYYAGSLENVLSRFIQAAENFDFDHIVRVCGDSPLIDHRLVQYAIDTYENFSGDLVTNTFPRTYPKGQSVEIFSKDLLKKFCKLSLTSEDLEHVTNPFYINHKDYSIHNFCNHTDLSNYQLSVDNAEDFARISNIIEELDGPPHLYEWKDFIELLKLT